MRPTPALSTPPVLLLPAERVMPLAMQRRQEREALGAGLRKLRIAHDRIVESMREPIRKLTADFQRIGQIARELGLKVPDEPVGYLEAPGWIEAARFRAHIDALLGPRATERIFRAPQRPHFRATPEFRQKMAEMQARVLAELGPGPGRDHG